MSGPLTSAFGAVRLDGPQRRRLALAVGCLAGVALAVVLAVALYVYGVAPPP